MKLTTVLFDLDGTLLPMDQDQFVKGYFGLLTQKLAPRGYDPKKLIDAIWAGTAAMVGNDGGRTNEAVFWARFAQIFGEEALADAREELAEGENTIREKEKEISDGWLTIAQKEAELADAMRRVLSDPPSADEMGDQARSVRKWVHPQHIYDQWKAYVESLIGGEVGNQL